MFKPSFIILSFTFLILAITVQGEKVTGAQHNCSLNEHSLNLGINLEARSHERFTFPADGEGDVSSFAAPGRVGVVSHEAYFGDGRPVALGVGPSQSDESPPRVWRGGELVEQKPFLYDAKWWYLLEPEGGESEGDVKSALFLEFEKSDQVSELLLIQLIDTAEEVHFETFITKGEAFRSAPAKHPSQDSYDVEHIRLELAIDMTDPDIPAAVAKVRARSLVDGLTTVAFDFNDNSGSFIASSVTLPNSTPVTFSQDAGNEWLVVTLPTPANIDDVFELWITYSGNPFNSSNRGYQRSTHSGAPVIYTHNQPYSARTWFPCKDLPEDKFTFELVGSVRDGTSPSPPDVILVSNGALESDTTVANERIFHWVSNSPIATQYVSIACSNYQVAAGTYTGLDGITTMPVAHYLYPEDFADESLELPRTIEVMEHFADLFGEYPFIDEKYVTAAWEINFGLEHQTATSMPDENLNQPYHRRNIHEMAHMWFGVSTGIEIFDHLWLSEGWATYAEALWLEHKNGIDFYHAQMATWEAATSDAVPIIDPSADGFNLSVTYRKGAWVLHMLRRVLGDSVFYDGVKNYIADADLPLETVVSADFQAYMEAAAGRDLSQFFDQWLTRASRPSYEWSWSSEASASPRGPSGNTINISIAQVQSDDVYVMPIEFDVVYTTGSRERFIVQNSARFEQFQVNVAAGSIDRLEFDPENWLLETNQLTTGPQPPTLLAVFPNSGGAQIQWNLPSGGTAGISGYRIYESPSGLGNWQLIADESTLSSIETSYQMGGLPVGMARYYRIHSFNGLEGIASDVYGLRSGASEGAQVVIVDGFDRWDSQISINNGLNHTLAVTHGRAIDANGVPFETYANEWFESAFGVFPSPDNIGAVHYILGNESTTDETFSDAEQILVSNYLRFGGRLFVSGDEIGWDLGRTSRPQTDQIFYRDYLKAEYIFDDSNDYDIFGSGAGSIFESDIFTFGSNDAHYFADFPDVIDVPGSSGAFRALLYDTDLPAGIQYFGPFSGGFMPGGVINVGFAIENILGEANRIQFIRRVLDAWGLLPNAAPSSLVKVY